MVKKRSEDSSAKPKKKMFVSSLPKIKKRINLAFKNLIVFSVLLILFFVLKDATEGKSSQPVFEFAFMVSIFIVLAFIISLFVLEILKEVRKNRDSKESSKSVKKSPDKKKTTKKKSTTKKSGSKKKVSKKTSSKKTSKKKK